MVERGKVHVAAWVALAVLTSLALAGCAGTRPGRPTPALQREAARPQRPSADQVTAAVVEAARSQLGKPYVWAGCTPDKGFDCSGLVWWAYGQSGVNLPRQSIEQIDLGRPVKPEQLRPADLVFFETDKTSKSLHVGIYTGGGYFIHSPTSGSRVREESMWLRYWRERFVGARRVID